MLLRALVAVPEGRRQRRLKRILTQADAVVGVVSGRTQLRQRVAREPWDVVLIDAELAAGKPLDELPAGLEMVVVAERPTADDRAGFLGAGYLTVLDESVDDRLLLDVVRGLLDRLRSRAHERIAAEPFVSTNELDDFSTNSEVMRGLLKLARKVATSSTTTLIAGETGVGKEWLARAIHGASDRSGEPFIAVNCAALTDTLLESELFGHEEGAFTGAVRARRGRFELAHRGTLFLDEIGEMPMQVQAKLLRALQEKEIVRVGGETTIAVDVRIMTASNRNLRLEVAEGRFRADLFYRIGVVTLEVPPLRERVEDIPPLAQSHLERFRVQLGCDLQGFEAAALDALRGYAWPGNVRELINVIERAVLLGEGDSVTLADLPPEIAEAAAPDRTDKAPPTSAADWVERGLDLAGARDEVLEEFERAYLADVLRAAGGRIGRAAELAGMNPRSLYEKLRRWDLRKEDFRN